MMRKFFVALLFLLLFLPACRRASTKVVLLGFDGADWDFIEPLIEKGKLPAFAKLRREGCWARLRSDRPTISAVIWTSIATGKRMTKHGIVDWFYVKKHNIRVPFNTSERREPAIWEILSQNNKKSIVINWFVSYPPDPVKGVVVSDQARVLVTLRDVKKYYKFNDVVYPPQYFQVLLDLIDRNYKKALEETGLPDYPELMRKRGWDPSTVPVLKNFTNLLLQERFVERVGRYFFENLDFDFFALYFRFPDLVTHFSGRFLTWADTAEAFRQIKEQHRLDPELKRKLDRRMAEILLPVYRYLDRVLDYYMNHIDSNTYLLVLSDHGFDFGPRGYDHNMPDWMDPPDGIFALVGPGVKRGVELQKASIYDITPTILYIFGLPSGKEMDGHPLTEAFEFKRKLRLRRYRRPARAKKHKREMDRRTLEELRSLGYID